ncbi:unnamed protein product [Lactuca virosa]|uniref:Uncharacterized protein n=1 Tax=Lactuca virosa TaxID=75947 RepID=A0AAU9MUU3_9ASTR|nr:unnamed protein product [Lactuca virosa]
MLTSKIRRNHGFVVEEERRCRVAQEYPQLILLLKKPGKKCKVWEWIDEEPENMKPIVEHTLSDVVDYLIQVFEDVASVREEVKQLKVMHVIPQTTSLHVDSNTHLHLPLVSFSRKGVKSGKLILFTTVYGTEAFTPSKYINGVGVNIPL